MKNYAKIGNRPGKPAYRTQAMFRIRNYLKVSKLKAAKSPKGPRPWYEKSAR
jgi:hypothetical protein